MMRKHKRWFWTGIIYICLIFMASLSPSLLYGSEILKSDLAKIDISIEEAAKTIKWTGCIDRAWKIGSIICIEEGNLTSCFGKEKAGKVIKDGTNLEDSESTVKPKAVVDWLSDEINQLIKEKIGEFPYNGDIKEKDEYNRNYAIESDKHGYLLVVLNMINFIDKLTSSDIKLGQKCMDELRNNYSDYDLSRPERLFKSIKGKFNYFNEGQ